MDLLHKINEAAHDEIDDDAALNSDLSRMEEDHLDDLVESPKATPQGCFTVLTESKIKQLQEESINEVSSLLLIPESEACLLLTHYGWSLIKVYDAWFHDEARTRELVGLMLSSDPRFNNIELKLTCEICYYTLPCNQMKAGRCGHRFCTNCWKKYVDNKILEGSNQCLKLRCPAPSCGAAVDGDMIRQFASESNRNKYYRFLFRSYVETNKNMKWCPSPGCDFAIAYEPDGADYNHLEATCLCNHSFCWKCGEDAHRPMSCETVSEWITMNQTELESTLWVFAYTKPCPGCSNAIEKNEGCMHMLCTICGFEFCWLCLRGWETCFISVCNRFSERRSSSLSEKESELEHRRKKAKVYLERYTHYYERWASNEFSRKKALEVMISYIKKDENVRNMCKRDESVEADLEFLNVAWGQVIECRRLLKWTYAYGYFIPEDEEAKKEFFEYTQGIAENALETLHQYAEKVLRIVLGGRRRNGSDMFRSKLMHLTNVTRKFFENLVNALENNGLDDVCVKSYGGVKKGSRENVGDSSRTTKGGGGLVEEQLTQGRG